MKWVVKTDSEPLIENFIAQNVQQLAKKVDNLFGKPQCEALKASAIGLARRFVGTAPFTMMCLRV